MMIMTRQLNIVGKHNEHLLVLEGNGKSICHFIPGISIVSGYIGHFNTIHAFAF